MKLRQLGVGGFLAISSNLTLMMRHEELGTGFPYISRSESWVCLVVFHGLSSHHHLKGKMFGSIFFNHLKQIQVCYLSQMLNVYGIKNLHLPEKKLPSWVGKIGHTLSIWVWKWSSFKRNLAHLASTVFGTEALEGWFFFSQQHPTKMFFFKSELEISETTNLGCDIGGAKEIGVMDFPTNWGAKEPQHLPNHRVAKQYFTSGNDKWYIVPFSI